MGRLIYGTAWKKEETDKLVYCALKEGFREISTAAQPINYEEALVALGVRRAIDTGVVARPDVSVRSPLFSVSSCLPSVWNFPQQFSQGPSLTAHHRSRLRSPLPTTRPSGRW